MNIQRILLSLAIAVFASSVVIGGTGAFFSDEETSTGNVFAAGAIDLRIDSQAHYNGLVCVQGVWELEPGNDTAPDYPVIGNDCGGTWELTDLGPTHTFFDYNDLKPGDMGENTISLHVENNEAWACVNIVPTVNDDVSSNEPELEAGDTEDTDSIFDGELAQNMQFDVWADICDEDAEPGDNIYQIGCDVPLTSGTGPTTPTSYPIVTPDLNVFTNTLDDPLTPDQVRYIGLSWSIPTSVGNIIQSDLYQADISFYVEQSRHNEEFECPELEQVPNVLRLENETEVVDGPWIVHDDDEIFADLTWSDGPTFAYTLDAQGLAASTQYALIYYADGWPGNNPGAFIGHHTTDGNGDIVGGADSPDLGIDMPTLPDGNFAVGAKIWLVLASDYNGGAAATGPMTAWNPDDYLFEGNVYIHYNDTGI